MAGENTRARIVTPPFNPNAPDPTSGIGGTSNNLNTLLESILGPRRQEVGAQAASAGKVSPIVSIIEALASGITTATSPNPSAALGAQLGRIQDVRLAKEMDAQKAQRDLDNIGIQVRLQELSNQMAEQRNISAEGRAEAAQVRKSKRDEDAAVVQFNREMAGKERLINIDFEQNVKIAKLKNQFDIDNLERNQEYQTAAAKAEGKDRRAAKAADVALSLVSFGADVGTSAAIARKLLNDEELSASEIKALDRAMKAQQAAQLAAKRRGGGSGGAGGGAISQKQAFGLMQEFAKTPMVLKEDGTVVEASAVEKGIDGLMVGVKRYLTPAEAAEYAATTVLPMMVAAASGRPNAAQQAAQQQTVQGPAPLVLSEAYDSRIQQLRAQKIPDDEIRAQLRAKAEQSPEQRETIEGAMIRNKLSGERKFKPGTATKQAPTVTRPSFLNK